MIFKPEVSIINDTQKILISDEFDNIEEAEYFLMFQIFGFVESLLDMEVNEKFYNPGSLKMFVDDFNSMTLK